MKWAVFMRIYFTVATSRTYRYTPRQKNLTKDCIGNEKRNWLAGWHMGGKARTALSIPPQQLLSSAAPAQSLHPHPSKRLQNRKRQSAADILHWRPHPRHIYVVLTSRKPFSFIRYQNYIYLREMCKTVRQN